MNNKILFFIIVFFVKAHLNAQQFDALIHHAWDHNQQLKAKSFQLQAAEANYQYAKAMYGPSADFGLQYTLAAGGRTIDLPIGDLLNPVYGTLNQLTQTNNFPKIDNTAIQFLPNNFYDAKISIKQPIYYPDLAINKEVQNQQRISREIEIKAHKRVISQDVMVAYMQLKSAKKAINIYNNALTTIDEAIRTTKSMISNGIATPVALSRIENQKAAIETQLIEARNNEENADKYLRFVSSWPQNQALPQIILDSLPQSSPIVSVDKEEILLIKQGIKMTELGKQKEAQFYLPRIGAGLDLGSQDFNFGWQPYGILGINMQVALYDHKRHKIKQDIYNAEMASYQSQVTHVNTQFMLASDIAYRNLVSTIDQAKSIEPRIQIARKVYTDALRRYKEGTTNYVDVLDAQSQITQTELQLLLAQNKAWTKWAEYVYTNASYYIP
jgi:outer membrane protein TolC